MPVKMNKNSRSHWKICIVINLRWNVPLIRTQPDRILFLPDVINYPFKILLLVITQVWNQNGRTPYITYEYTVLRDALPPVPPPPVYTGSDTSAGEVSVEVEGVLAANSSIYGQRVPGGLLKSDGGAVQKGQETNEVYEETAAVDCDQDEVSAPKYSGSVVYNTLDLFV